METKLYPNKSERTYRAGALAHRLTKAPTQEDLDAYLSGSQVRTYDGSETIFSDTSIDAGMTLYKACFTPEGYGPDGPPASHQDKVVDGYLNEGKVSSEQVNDEVRVTLEIAPTSCVLEFARPSNAQLAEFDKAERRERVRAGGGIVSHERASGVIRLARQMIRRADGYESNAPKDIPAHHLMRAGRAVFRLFKDDIEFSPN